MQIARFGIALAAAIAATPLMAAQKQATPVKVAAATPVYPVAQPAAAAAPVAAAPVYPFAMPAAPAQPGALTSQQWLMRMGDFTQNASAFKDPRTFNQWFSAMTDPSMMAASIPYMMEPGSWIRTTSSMMQPGAVTNYMSFMDPAIYGRWMGAMMDPNFYLQNMWSMMDPSRMMRWMMLPLDPKMMQAGMSMLDPNNYMKWMMAPMDPRVWGLMFAPANPQLYGSMAGAMMNPASFGTSWQTFMYPKQPVVSLSPAAPVALPINVMDPSTWGNMLNMFGGFMPSGGTIIPNVSVFGTGPNPYLPSPAQAKAPAPAVAQVPAFQPGVPTKLALSGDTLFKSGKSSIKDLTPDGKVKLDALAAKIKAAGKIDTIRVIGHADKMGKASSNMKLSQARAAAVASYLKKQGVKAGKIITAGKGDTQPLVQCDAKLPKEELKACLQPNRRVEIEVTVAN
jgi:outer membrane protein OmpA-like peptidoglycan-associated protein